MKLAINGRNASFHPLVVGGVGVVMVCGLAAPASAAPHEVSLHAPGDRTALVGGCTGFPVSGGRAGMQCTEGTWARYKITVVSTDGAKESRLALGPELGVTYVGPGCSYFGTETPTATVTFRVIDGDGSNGHVDGRAAYRC